MQMFRVLADGCLETTVGIDRWFIIDGISSTRCTLSGDAQTLYKLPQSPFTHAPLLS